ncbi:MAG: hypothetical protein U0575_02675 [Phycisphaerales bacterium]|jgi:DNA-directed RNA polymerase specialized sigma24 family protein
MNAALPRPVPQCPPTAVRLGRWTHPTLNRGSTMNPNDPTPPAPRIPWPSRLDAASENAVAETLREQAVRVANKLVGPRRNTAAFDVDSIVHSTLARVLPKIREQQMSIDDARRYTLRAVHHEVITRADHEAVLRRHGVGVDPELAPSDVIGPATRSDLDEQRRNDREGSAVFEDAVGGLALSSVKRGVLIGRIVRDVGYATIALELDITEGAARQIMRRLRRELREWVDGLADSVSPAAPVERATEAAERRFRTDAALHRRTRALASRFGATIAARLATEFDLGDLHDRPGEVMAGE